MTVETADWRDFVKPYAGRPLVIDTNLLLLLIVGANDRNTVSTFRRTAHFTAEDFDTVHEIAAFFAERQGLATTPHILTEVSNLLGRRADLRAMLGAFLDKSNESWTHARELAAQRLFLRLGLTDTAIVDLAKTHCVLTVDAALADGILSSGGAAINYNHIRFPL